MQRQATRVLLKFSRVMQSAGIPFAWTDDKNAFRSANTEFLRLVGYNSLDDLKHNVPTFAAMLEAESSLKYKKMLDMAARGEDTEPYALTLVAKDGRFIAARIHGESIGVPSLFRQRVPHRFGVVLSAEAATP